ncbi:MAG: hypothetical protein EOP92_33720 [Lysobacteraceae bacterium]|nr:MAG: hypothetical protein EOP92_33720 [Xanthomonadaceae bacterium]
MKPLVVLLAICLAGPALALSAAAQTAAPEPTDRVAAPAAEPIVAPVAAQGQEAAADELADRNCLKETGSRVIRADRKGHKCAMAPGRAYTKGDIDRTGAIDLRDALRRLDPAVQ